MRTSAQPPKLLVSTPIEESLSALETRAADIAEWEGDDAGSVRSIRLCVAEVRRAMKNAEELWQTTAATAETTGWNEDTLTKYARLRLERLAMPHEWRGLEYRRAAGGGFLFRVSSVPQKPARRTS